AYLFVDLAQTSISYAIGYEDLSSPLVRATVNWGASGQNGPVMFDLAVRPGTLFGMLDAQDVQGSGQTWSSALKALRAGAAYVTPATTDHPGGELRAQLHPGTGAAPSPTRSVPSAPSTATELATGKLAESDILPAIVVLIASTVGGVLAVEIVRPG